MYLRWSRCLLILALAGTTNARLLDQKCSLRRAPLDVPHPPVPAYWRTYVALRDSLRIAVGPPGAKLPSQAELARRHGVSLETVRRALRLLQDEGYIHIIHGVGTFVSEQRPTSEAPESMSEADTISSATLQSTSELLEEVLRQMPAGVLIASVPSGRLLLCNEQVDRIWLHDFPPSEDVAHYYQHRQGLHPDGRPYTPEEWPLVRSIKTGELVAGEEVEILRGDGTRGTMRASSGPVHDRSGRVIAAVGAYYDITERKRDQEAQQFLSEAGVLLASSLDYEATLQSLARVAVPHLADWLAIDTIEEDGRVRRLVIAHADPAHAGLAEQLKDQYPQYRPDLKVRSGIPRVLQTGTSEFYPEVTDSVLVGLGRSSEHLRIIRKIGMRSIMLVPLVARGRVLGALACARAESGRRYESSDLALAEELASRAALAIDNALLYREAQRAVRVRDDFLASASHELRTPLGHVKGFVSTLRQSDVDWDEETRRDFLGEIEREADRLSGMITNLLDMSRIESGGLEPLERSPAPLSALVSRGVARVRGLLEGRRVLVDMAADLPPVPVDDAQIERVVANLVENAARYSPAGRPVRISAMVVGGKAQLRVEDEGSGIPACDQERVFEKFYRSTPNGSGVGGTGLGLAICRGIVEAHGGSIWAANRPGGGACLTVHLPLAIQAIEAHQ